MFSLKVNEASRMDSTGQTRHIQVTHSVYKVIKKLIIVKVIKIHRVNKCNLFFVSLYVIFCVIHNLKLGRKAVIKKRI